MTSWAVIQHVDYERPGSIAKVAGELGIELRTVHAHRNQPLPDADEVSGVIVMGGPMSVNDAAELPFLADEINLLREAIAAELPVLGVCLGAQLIASALGAKVYPGAEPEIGFGRVHLTKDGLADPVLGNQDPTLPVFHWHGETFDLPAGCASLATTALYPNQAFRAGSSVLALQFHTELTPALLDSWRPELPANLELNEGDLECVELNGRMLVRAFLVTATS